MDFRRHIFKKVTSHVVGQYCELSSLPNRLQTINAEMYIINLDDITKANLMRLQKSIIIIKQRHLC